MVSVGLRGKEKIKKGADCSELSADQADGRLSREDGYAGNSLQQQSGFSVPGPRACLDYVAAEAAAVFLFVSANVASCRFLLVGETQQLMDIKKSKHLI